MMFFFYIFCFCEPFLEKHYKEPAVRVPSLSRLSDIAKGLGLDMEGSELMAYRGRFFTLGYLFTTLSFMLHAEQS